MVDSWLNLLFYLKILVHNPALNPSTQAFVPVKPNTAPQVSPGVANPFPQNANDLLEKLKKQKGKKRCQGCIQNNIFRCGHCWICSGSDHKMDACKLLGMDQGNGLGLPGM